MSQEIDTLMPHDLINAKPVGAVVKEYFGSLAALAVHGPDEPAQRGDAQASPLGARAGRSHARARGLRGARRARHALRPHLPDRDAGRSEHRPHRVALDVRARQRVRLRRDAVPQGRATARVTRRGAAGSARSRKRASTSRRRPPTSTRRASFKQTPGERALQRRLPHGHAGADPADGRGAEPDGVGRRGARAVPRARRREPRAHGREHAAPGRAARPHRGAARRHRHGSAASRSTRACASIAKRDGVVESVDADAHRRARRLGRRRRGAGHLPPHQVPALEPEHLLQPEADRSRRARS